jgi:hypothetical protein
MIRLLCSPDFKTEWQLEVGNLSNVVLIGASGSPFPDDAGLPSNGASGVAAQTGTTTVLP